MRGRRVIGRRLRRETSRLHPFPRKPMLSSSLGCGSDIELAGPDATIAVKKRMDTYELNTSLRPRMSHQPNRLDERSCAS